MLTPTNDPSPLWAAGTYQEGNSLQMQTDGNLVVYTATGQAVWSANTWGHLGAFLTVQDDGNLVVYQGSQAIWSTGTGGITETIPAAPSSCGLIRANEGLGPGMSAASCDGLVFLSLQTDSNLVLYQSWENWNRSPALWSSGTYTAQLDPSRSGYALWMQQDGNLVLYSPRGNPVWSSNTYGNPGAFTAIQGDGDLVIYTADGRAIWATHTQTQNDEPGNTDQQACENIATTAGANGGFSGFSCVFSPLCDALLIAYNAKGCEHLLCAQQGTPSWYPFARWAGMCK